MLWSICTWLIEWPRIKILTPINFIFENELLNCFFDIETSFLRNSLDVYVIKSFIRCICMFWTWYCPYSSFFSSQFVIYEIQIFYSVVFNCFHFISWTIFQCITWASIFKASDLENLPDSPPIIFRIEE